MWWFAAFIAVGLGGASPAAAGTLELSVVDEIGLPIPAVAIALDGPGHVEGATDVDGTLRIDLADGTWSVTASKAGFRTTTVHDLVLGDAVTVSTELVLAVESRSEEVVLVESRGQVLSKDFLVRVPSGRSYQSAVQLSSGVVGGGGNPNMGGGAYNENTYLHGGTESYEAPGFHHEVLAEDDRLSTFAVDVDTASYALARRKLTEGTSPPTAAVRVEEFVNAFRYDYPPPAEGLDVRLEAAPHPLRPQNVVLSVAVTSPVAEEQARPVRLTFLVDVSGSMASPDKLPLVRYALHELVRGLGEEDRVALVTYAGRTAVELEPTATVHPELIHRAIDRLTSGGSTAMGSGIQLAYQMAERMVAPGAENRVVILTDGDANVGTVSAEGLLGLVQRWAGKGIGLSVVGFGDGNYKDALLEKLADQGDGNYHYVDGRAEADRVFRRDLAANLVTVARDVKVQVEFPEAAVLSWRQIGYENRAVADEDFRDDGVDGGEIGLGHQVTALYELVLRDRPSGDLAQVRLRAEPPGPEAPAIELGEAFASSAVGSDYGAASTDLRWATSVATFAEVLRGSPFEAETTWDQVLALVHDAVDPEDADQRELESLTRIAADLAQRSASSGRR